MDVCVCVSLHMALCDLLHVSDVLCVMCSVHLRLIVGGKGVSCFWS